MAEAGNGHTQRTIADSYTDRPELADLFEMQGWMPRILFQHGKVFVSKALYGERQAGITVQKTWRSVMNQSGLHCPAP